jgi:hypothetical protein
MKKVNVQARITALYCVCLSIFTKEKNKKKRLAKKLTISIVWMRREIRKEISIMLSNRQKQISPY